MALGTQLKLRTAACYASISASLQEKTAVSNVGIHLLLPQYAISSRSNNPNPTRLPKTPFLALWIIQTYIFVTFKWSSMTSQPCQMLENIKCYQNLQYHIDSTDLSQENDQKTHFWLFGSLKYRFL